MKDAMTKAMTEGSQTFEEDIARLIMTGKVAREEGLVHADSATNLLWRLQNTPQHGAKKMDDAQAFSHSAEPSFSGSFDCCFVPRLIPGTGLIRI